MREYCEIKCSEACHRIKSGFPYKWDLNIYRGCEHRCVYCFAVYSHRYIGGEASAKPENIDEYEQIGFI